MGIIIAQLLIYLCGSRLAEPQSGYLSDNLFKVGIFALRLIRPGLGVFLSAYPFLRTLHVFISPSGFSYFRTLASASLSSVCREVWLIDFVIFSTHMVSSGVVFHILGIQTFPILLSHWSVCSAVLLSWRLSSSIMTKALNWLKLLIGLSVVHCSGEVVLRLLHYPAGPIKYI